MDFVKPAEEKKVIAYSFPNGFEREAMNIMGWMRHQFFQVEQFPTKNRETILVIPEKELEQLKILQKSQPQRWGNLKDHYEAFDREDAPQTFGESAENNRTLPCKAGDVLLCRGKNGMFNLYVIEHIKEASERSGNRDRGRNFVLYDAANQDKYFHEDEYEGENNQNSPFLKSVVGVMDSRVITEQYDPSSVVVEPVILSGLRDDMNACDTVEFMQPHAYAVKSKSSVRGAINKVRGLFKDSDTAEMYANILRENNLNMDVVPPDTAPFAWNLVRMNAFNAPSNQQESIKKVFDAISKAQTCFTNLYHEYPDLQDVSLKSMMALTEMYRNLNMATKNRVFDTVEDENLVSNNGHQPEIS